MLGLENNLQFVDLPTQDNTVSKTLCMINYHRNYMANVFNKDKKIPPYSGVDKKEVISMMSLY
jgi:hypothetical protein